ncbi:RrF2 family transcriptional regulator [Sulfuriroseicoccus oceanibius]|uniref:Rrf2 family transcriptional regulator n=1 Tax=Sulfuriroseicoccus oceanibius TaxID=2707525 RepID=A0A6B3LBJ3_9BACT|nr:Rrf2 family transcriptional regulator [Sulfuriroseicoccus oceanibius]QQL44544.1 Rrf2 family transcriptional regulator [Sulfuriroseicoccus oceanibius]
MKISRKLENACRVLVQLANRYDAGGVSRVEELAQAEEVSSSFLLQILNDLRKSGLVSSKRGKFGGYQLARPPREISLGQVVEALEGGLIDVDLEVLGESGQRVVSAWQEIARHVDAKLHATTLEDMAGTASADMFYI